MRKRYWIPLLILVLLVAFRIALPTIVKNYVNKTLDNLEGYTGSVDDVDIALYRGAYAIDSLKIEKLEGDNPVPFVAIDRIDLSVQWNALLKGRVVGEIALLSPDLNFVAANDAGEGGQSGQEADWTQTVKDLIPLEINRFTIKDGTIRYLDPAASPNVDISIEKMQLEALNLTNADDSTVALPSSLSVTGTSIGGGQLNLNGKLNILKQTPDLDMNMEFEGINVPDLNDFLEAYAKVDAEKGQLAIYSEIAINDGAIEGYVKPILTDLQLLSLKEDADKPLRAIWEGVVGLVTNILENPKEDQFATKVPITGNLNQSEVGVMPTVWNVFRNAFVQAFARQTEGEIDFSDAG
ncbi:MAG: DUF748 domain-containing protein [Catalinimonas sp.]